MTAEDAIRNLMFRYCEHMDAGEIDDVADMFANAKIIGQDGNTMAEGRDQVIAMFSGGNRQERTSGGRRSKHITTNVFVEANENTGTGFARSYWVLLISTSPEEPVRPILAGSYHDKFARVDGDWRFTERAYIVDLTGSEAAVMLQS